jgi:hypothetical protein
MHPLFHLVTMDFPYATETVCIFMSIQGSMAVRNGPNKSNAMHWFHAFVRSTLTAYAGATFTNIFMGRPTAMLANDVFFASCIIGYGIVNWLPYNVGYHFFNTILGVALHTIFSQIFRVSGIIGFSDAAYSAFKENPSAYYPIPVFGPILFPATLGNMGGFLWNGFDGYLEGGMPWLFQQGLVCSTMYHFYAHDVVGSIGVTLRSLVKPMVAIPVMTLLGADDIQAQDDVLFAKFCVGLFMVGISILQLPMLLGPKFSPFVGVYNVLTGKTFVGGQKRKAKHTAPASSSNGSKKGKKKTQ